MNNLEIALKYLKKGWSIIPIQKGSKIPAIQTWTQYQKTLPTEDEVKNWWTIWKDANIALICGEISGVIVVDIDIKDGEPDKKGLELPVTLSQKTGSGGSHLIYKWRKGLVGAKVGIRKGIDIRSDNSYIVLPPSIHPNGNSYQWSIDEDEHITEAPKWLELNKQEKEVTDWDKVLNKKTIEGMRNMTATKIAGKILFETSPELWETLGISYFKQWNKEFNNPPLNEDELLTTWKSIKKTHLRNNKIEIPDDIDINHNEETQIKKLYIKNKKKGTYVLANYITSKYKIITIGEKDREMYIYKDGMYHPGAENLIIFPEIQRILGDEVDKSAKTETFHKIADATSHPRDIFTDAPINLIPLKNGVYDFENDILLEHSSNYHFLYQFPIIFNKKATCPKTADFFLQILSPEQKILVEEWIGYYFYRYYMFKKAIIFVGAGDTGKTTLLEVITYLLGNQNISSVPLQKMTSDKFSAAHLYNKHGNLVDELSARDITDTGAFKMATGGGTVTGEYKFGNQFSFHNFSKFTFACNRIPDVGDTNDEAYFNRWMVVRFENQIKKIIPNFVNTLKTEEERSGLFNVAINGLKRLLEGKRFSYFNTAEDTKKEMLRSGSSISMFVSDKLEYCLDNIMTKDEMYNEYVTYCHQNKLSAQTKEMLGRRLSDYTNYIVDGQSTAGYKNIRVWRNVCIKGEKEQILKDREQAEKEFNEA